MQMLRQRHFGRYFASGANAREMARLGSLIPAAQGRVDLIEIID